MSHTKESLCSEVKDYNAYHHWLFKHVKYREFKRYGRDYSKLLNYLEYIPFRYSIPRDENRAYDGYDLRIKYEVESGREIVYLGGPVNCLEVFIALSMRMDEDLFEENKGDGPAQWFWIMMENCGLDEFTNEFFDEYAVRHILDGILDRKFSRNGRNGLFPLKKTEKDQREVEIWYQMQAYILENYGI